MDSEIYEDTEIVMESSTEYGEVLHSIDSTLGAISVTGLMICMFIGILVGLRILDIFIRKWHV